MKRGIILAALFALVALVWIGCGGGEEKQTSRSANRTRTKSAAKPTAQLAKGSAETGKPLFVTYCSACHGPGAKGLPNLGKDLTHNTYVQGMDDETFLAYVNTGRPVDDPRNTSGVPMPPKGGNPALKNQDIMHIIAFVRSLQ